MHLRSGKDFKTMTKSVNTGASMSSQSSQSFSQAHFTRASAPAVGASVSTVVGETMAMPVSTKMGVTAPTVTATMRQQEMGNVVPPFTVGVPVSKSVPTCPNSQVRSRFDDRVINTHTSLRTNCKVCQLQ